MVRIPEAIEHSVTFAEHAAMPGAVADAIVGGFVCLRTTSDVACEIYVMAVRPALSAWPRYSTRSCGNDCAGAYTLPQQATITADMPHDKLDADGSYGDYALNAPDAFSAAE